MTDQVKKLLSLEVRLDFPVEIDGRTVDRITFRRMKGKDQQVLAKLSGNTTDLSYRMFSMLAQEPLLSPDQFGELDMSDLERIETQLGPFLGLKSVKPAAL